MELYTQFKSTDGADFPPLLRVGESTWIGLGLLSSSRVRQGFLTGDCSFNSLCGRPSSSVFMIDCFFQILSWGLFLSDLKRRTVSFRSWAEDTRILDSEGVGGDSNQEFSGAGDCVLPLPVLVARSLVACFYKTFFYLIFIIIHLGWRWSS